MYAWILHAGNPFFLLWFPDLEIPPLEVHALAIFGVLFSISTEHLADLRFTLSCALIEPKLWYDILDIYFLFCSKFETNPGWSHDLVRVARLHQHQFFCWTDNGDGLYLFCGWFLDDFWTSFLSEILICRSWHIWLSDGYYLRSIWVILVIWQRFQVWPKLAFLHVNLCRKMSFSLSLWFELYIFLLSD